VTVESQVLKKIRQGPHTVRGEKKKKELGGDERTQKELLPSVQVEEGKVGNPSERKKRNRVRSERKKPENDSRSEKKDFQVKYKARVHGG